MVVPINPVQKEREIIVVLPLLFPTFLWSQFLAWGHGACGNRYRIARLKLWQIAPKILLAQTAKTNREKKT